MMDQPTRLVRARDLVKGATIVHDCTLGARHCPFAPSTHGDGNEIVEHLLTVFDAEIHNDELSAIVVSEAGSQGQIGGVGWNLWRVVADTMPLAVDPA